MVKLMVHMFLVASTAQEEICVSKSCAAEQLSLIQAGRFRSGQQPDHSQDPLGCSSKTDQDETAIGLGAQFGHTLHYGCLELKSLCNAVPDYLGGASTLALIRETCPETCGVPCEAECPPVYQCGWGMLTTVAQTTEGCDVVTCRLLRKPELTKCPWLVGTSGTNFTFKCGDGTTCGITNDDKDCCNDKEGRVQCPKNYPYMCNEPCPLCDPAGVSFSCQRTNCNANGGYRTCDFLQARLPREQDKLDRARTRAQKKADIKLQILENKAGDAQDADQDEDGWRPADDGAV